ncbi:MAG: CHAT domain-containing protein, partial [Acidobacteria bacterium]
LKYPAYAALHYPEPYDVERVQREVLDARTLLIEYRLGEERSFLWAVSKRECRMVALPGREEIARWVKRCRRAITSPPSSADAFDRYVYRAHRLYRLLLAPIEGTLARYERLIIVPDGILYHLPFEVLLTRRVTRETVHLPVLLVDHRISYAPSASVLGLMQREWRRADRRKAFIAYADPVLTTTPRRPGTSDHTTRSVGHPQRPHASHETMSLDGELVDITRHLYGERGMNLEPIPYTRVEVESIARLFPRKATRIYLGRAATESAVKREKLHARCVHFATHGFIDERIPARSGLVFSLVDEGNEDGVLQMDEVFNLDLDADLVVLSACRSGLGTLVKGEGLIGLTRAFLYAGARSLVVSLWSVRDASTADFMRRFYQYLRAGCGRAEALRRAKLAMMNSDIPAYRFPYFWAPFILIDRPTGQDGTPSLHQ